MEHPTAHADRLPLLDAAQIDRICKRLACQIWEQNYYAKALWLAGIAGQGTTLALSLARELSVLNPGFTVSTTTIQVDKRAASQPAILLDVPDAAALDGAVVVLVDDVLNSGRTLAYAMAPLLARPLAALQVAVLVERSHRAYPVSADFSGLKLATSLQQHVEVSLEGEAAAWLM